MTTQNEIIEKLDLTADQTVKVKEAYEDVLITKGEQDITLYDGTTTPNLNKRLAGIVQAVKSVNGKDGEVNITRDDLNIPSDEQLARQIKEDRFVITESGVNQREKNRDNLNLRDFCKGDGVTDDSNGFQLAVNTIKGGIVIPRNFKVLITKSIEVNNPDFKGIIGECPFSSELRFEGNGRFIAENTISQLPNISTANLIGANSLQFDNNITENIENQDVIVLWNPEPYSFSYERSYYYDGCMLVAHKYNATAKNLSIFGVVPHLNTSTINAYLMKRKPLILENFSYSVNNIRNAFRFTHFVGVRVNNVSSKNTDINIGIKLDKCYDVVVDGSNCSGSYDVAYPIQISNCQNFTFQNFTGTSSRHGIGLGGDDTIASIPCREGFIFNTTLLNYQPAGVNDVAVPVADTHANLCDIVYKDCTISSGAGINGKNITYDHCIIDSSTHPYNGRCANGNYTVGGFIKFKDCTFRINRRTTETTGSIVFAAPNAQVREKLTYIFKDCFIDIVSDTTNNGVFSLFRLTREWIPNLAVDIIIDGLHTNGTFSYNELIRLERPANPAGGSIVRISIKNVDGINYNAYVTGQIDESDTKINIRGWSVRGVIPLVSGADSATADIIIPTTYPRAPTIQCNALGIPGEGTGWLLGARGYAGTTTKRATVYANKVWGGSNLFTGNMNLILKSELIEF